MVALKEWSIGEKLLDYYVVEKVLGFGGMGRVYLLRNRITDDQYAVKRSLLEDVSDRRGFYLELLNWLDLPETPYIADCRFFRSIEEEIAIFAEYVSGGSIYDWMRSRRLSGKDQLIDIAIQMAWGLDTIHQHGLVHQDIKPKNVLLTENRIAKIADFGLARARARVHQIENHQAASSYVSFAGATQQFQSPEQADGKNLTRKTDIWSWGLTVLAMFAQEVFWLDGSCANEILEEYLKLVH